MVISQENSYLDLSRTVRTSAPGFVHHEGLWRGTNDNN